MVGLAIIGLVVLVGLAILAILIKFMYRVAEPNEALIVSGFGAGPERPDTSGLGFKIITGKGVFVLPLVQTARSLSLDMRKAEMEVRCVTTQGIPVNVRGVVVYKVGDAEGEIANAARRFLDRQEEMDANVHEVFAGHLRQIVGSLTVEDMIREREKLASEARESSATEMQRIGLVIDSLQIQEVSEPQGGTYIQSLALPHIAQVEAQARVAQAERNRDATEKEQAAAAYAAKAISDSEIQQAQLRAAAEREQQKAAQAGPLADAEARQEVVRQETMVAELEAARTERRLLTDIVRPAEAAREAQIATAQADARQVELQAEAQAAATKTLADANAHASEVEGRGAATAIEAKLTAEAKGIELRAHALAQQSDAVIATTIAENMEAIVRAAAEPFGQIESLVVLDGAEGLSKALLTVMQTATALLPLVQEGLANGAANGKPEAARMVH